MMISQEVPVMLDKVAFVQFSGRGMIMLGISLRSAWHPSPKEMCVTTILVTLVLFCALQTS